MALSQREKQRKIWDLTIMGGRPALAEADALNAEVGKEFYRRSLQECIPYENLPTKIDWFTEDCKVGKWEPAKPVDYVHLVPAESWAHKTKMNVLWYLHGIEWTIVHDILWPIQDWWDSKFKKSR